ncbi:DUF1028 domain-containing protein [Spirosoma gilvum]
MNRLAKRLFLTGLLLTCSFIQAYATWSIIVIDPRTKEIGIAGASCTYSVYGIGSIVPGKGAVIVQAMSNGAARALGRRMIMADAPPEQILDAMKDPDFDPEEQQYAIVCVNYYGKELTYTGSEVTPFKGALTANGISVQGNTLASPDELQAVLNTALQAQKEGLPLEEVLMLALEAGAKLGGDKRCGDRKASSAFLTIAKPADSPQKPYLNLIVYGINNTINAVEVLRKKLDDWKRRK